MFSFFGCWVSFFFMGVDWREIHIYMWNENKIKSYASKFCGSSGLCSLWDCLLPSGCAKNNDE